MRHRALALVGSCGQCHRPAAVLLSPRRSGEGRVLLNPQYGTCPSCGAMVDHVSQVRNPLLPWWGWVTLGAGIGVVGSMVFFKPFKALRTGLIAGWQDYRTRPPGRPRGSQSVPATATLTQNPLPPAAVERLRQRFAAFHGIAPKKLRLVHLPDAPQAAWLLGKAESISYVPPGYSRRSDGGQPVEYVHAFGDRGLGRKDRERPLLAASLDGRQLILYRGPSRFTVTERGIVG